MITGISALLHKQLGGGKPPATAAAAAASSVATPLPEATTPATANGAQHAVEEELVGAPELTGWPASGSWRVQPAATTATAYHP